MAIRTADLLLDLRGSAAGGAGPNSNAGADKATWFDCSGNSRNVSLSNFDWSAQSGWAGAGTVGDPYRLIYDGANDTAAIVDSTWQEPSLITVEVWFRRSETTTPYMGVIDKLSYATGFSAGYNIDFGSGTETGHVRFVLGDGTGGAVCVVGPYLADGLFHHVVGTWDGTTAKLYVDGALYATSVPGRPVITPTAQDLRIGGDYPTSSTNPFSGEIAQARIYGAAISAGDVAGNYAAGVNAGPPEVAPPVDPPTVSLPSGGPGRLFLPSRFVEDEAARRNFAAIEDFVNHSGGLDRYIANSVDISPAALSPASFDPCLKVGAPAPLPPTLESAMFLTKFVSASWTPPTDFANRMYEVQYAVQTYFEGAYIPADQSGLSWMPYDSNLGLTNGTAVTFMAYCGVDDLMWVRVRSVVKDDNTKRSDWVFLLSGASRTNVGGTYISNVFADTIVSRGAYLDSAVIGELDVSKCRVVGPSGKVAIDDTGIEVTGGDFRIKDPDTGMMQVVRDTPNMIWDHSIELASVNLTAGQEIYSTTIPKVYKLKADPGALAPGNWRPVVDATNVYDGANTGIISNPSEASSGRFALFDERALELRSGARWDYIAPVDPADPLGPYSLSLFLARTQRTQAGTTPVVTVALQPLTSAYTSNGTAETFTITPDAALPAWAWRRHSVTTAADFPANTAFVKVSLKANGYLAADGIQLVSRSHPVPYLPESSFMRYMNGTLPYERVGVLTSSKTDGVECHHTLAINCALTPSGWRPIQGWVNTVAGVDLCDPPHFATDVGYFFNETMLAAGTAIEFSASSRLNINSGTWSLSIALYTWDDSLVTKTLVKRLTCAGLQIGQSGTISGRVIVPTGGWRNLQARLEFATSNTAPTLVTCYGTAAPEKTTYLTHTIL